MYDSFTMALLPFVVLSSCLTGRMSLSTYIHSVCTLKSYLYLRVYNQGPLHDSARRKQIWHNLCKNKKQEQTEGLDQSMKKKMLERKKSRRDFYFSATQKNPQPINDSE
jgi:hypothetical protein